MLCDMSRTEPLSPEALVILTDAAAFDWSTVSHAYGDASDVPEMLRRLTAGDDEALSDLAGSICHQGTVYSASTAVVPFLARLAAAGAAAKECLWLLGYMAASDDTAPGAEDDVRDAVVAHRVTLAPLVGHPDREVRQAAVHTLGQTRSDLLVALLLGAFDDDGPLARAEAVIGLVRCGAPDPTDLVARACQDRDETVRVAGVLAALEADLDWHDTLSEALLSVSDPDGSGALLLDDRNETLAWIVERLCEAGRSEDAAGMLLTAAERGTVKITSVLWAANQACETSRVASELLRPLAAAHADSEDFAARTLAANLGLRPGHAPLPLPHDATPDQKLGDDATLSVNELRARLAEPLPEYARLTTPMIDRKLTLAAAVWERAGDPHPVLSTVTEVADRLAGRDDWIWGFQRAAAARTAARLGPHAAPLESVLREFLDDPIALAAAARALMLARCDLDVDEVATRLAGQVGRNSDHDTINALAALAPHLSPETVRTWQCVIEGDARLVGGGGPVGTVVAADEQLRDALRAALAPTTGAGD